MIFYNVKNSRPYHVEAIPEGYRVRCERLGIDVVVSERNFSRLYMEESHWQEREERRRKRLMPKVKPTRSRRKKVIKSSRRDYRELTCDYVMRYHENVSQFGCSDPGFYRSDEFERDDNDLMFSRGNKARVLVNSAAIEGALIQHGGSTR